MKLRYIIPLFCAFLFCTNAYSVNSTVMTEQTQLTGKIIESTKKKTWFSKAGSKLKNTISSAKAGLLDSPKRILIYAGLALLGGIVFSLVAAVIGVSVIGTLAWILYVLSFALVILFVYTILIRR